jgi:hypothetical protein
MPADEIQIGYAPWRDSDRRIGQWYVHQSQARFRLVMAGRQSGKSLCAISEICVDAMAYPGHINWWVVNNLEVKPRAWRGLLDFLPKAVLAGKPNETDRRIRLTNGSEIWVKSAAGDDSLVSESLNLVVCDEAGLWKETAWTMGVRPMLTVKTDPPRTAILVGTPRGKNWFYRAWQRGNWRNCSDCSANRDCSQHDRRWESFHWKTEDSPFSDPADLDEARSNLPIDIFKQEYEADPLDSSGGVFKNVRNCVVTGTAEPDRFTCLGVDLGQKNDYTAIIPMNSQRRALFVERSQEEYPIQRQRLAHLSMQLNFARLVVDEANVGLQMTQELRNSGLAVEAVPTNSSTMKRALIDNLRIAFQNGTVQIPNDATLIDELESYTYEVLKSGHIRYSAPEGQHDDTVIALALALWGQRGAMSRPGNRGRGPESYMRRGRGESYMRRSA